MACATYQSALEEVCQLASRDAPAAVTASNTHLIATARRDPSFAAVLQKFDLILPDGMPLIRLMNAAGAGLTDRVYGPYFMRFVLRRTPRPWRHFFFGGKPETLAKMVETASVLQPEIEMAGTCSPPFREWTEADHPRNAEAIMATRPDFIWVALGGERQERWIIEQRHRFPRGVFLAVGDAFELLAGTRPFAPAWMQRSSLTWLYRLAQDPGRLGRRYLLYNSLFLYYLLIDGLRGRAIRKSGIMVAFLAFCLHATCATNCA